MRRLMGILIALVVTFGSVTISPPAHAALPSFLEGRQYFSLALQVAQTDASNGDSRGFVRLSHIELAVDGTVTERYWSHSFAQVPATTTGTPWLPEFAQNIASRPTGCLQGSPDVSFRASVGFVLPSGTCDVRTSKTFFDPPTERKGTWAAISDSTGNKLRFTWNATSISETFWNAPLAGKNYSELRLVHHTHPNATNAVGFMFGSTRSPDAAATSMVPWVTGNAVLRPPASASSSVAPPGVWNAQNNVYWSRQWGQSGFSATGQTSFLFGSTYYEPASGGSTKCIKSTAAQRVATDGWHSYWCPQPTHRKVVWHNMKSAHIASGHGLSSNAAASNYSIPLAAGGHLFMVLQFMDDAGNLQGIVGIEASLYRKASAGAFMAVIAAVHPSA